MWGIIPAAGQGSRMQPLAFSKELLPVGSRREGDRERPRAVSEYLIERLILGGASRLCFVISPGKSDILEYYGGSVFSADVFYAVQPAPAGLCDAIFRAAPLVADDDAVLVGLPDTIWFPEDGLAALPLAPVSMLCFPVQRPELFDAVVMDSRGRVEQIQVKVKGARSTWVWGAFRLTGRALHDLHALWRARQPRDEYFGTLVNAFIAGGGEVAASCTGRAYVDVGTVEGYREAIALLTAPPSSSLVNGIKPAI